MQVNILGQEYSYEEIKASDDIKMGDGDGYCDGYGKIIRINNDYASNHPTCISDLEGYKRQVRRHEIIHAFFHESGLEKYCSDEIMVDWIARQFPKITKVFQQVGAL